VASVKVTHNPHSSWQRPSAEVDPRYQAEVDRSVERAEQAYARAVRRLERAEQRLRKARAGPEGRRKEIRRLAVAVEQRRAELGDWRKLMTRYFGMPSDKQIRQRTGQDDHLELGVPKRRRTVAPPPHPVNVQPLGHGHEEEPA
jgi:hypothetical protein